MKQFPPLDKVLWPGSTQLAPVPVVLLGCGDGGATPYNLITVAWAGTVCSKPPMLSVAIRPERHSHGIIRAAGVFTVNLPTAAMAAAVDYCGVASGREHDKFAECGLTPVVGSQVAAPVIAECPLALECRTTQVLELGSHHLFLAEIVAVQAAAAFLEPDGRFDLERAGLLAYVHGHYYNLGRCLGHFGYSVRKKPGAKTRRPDRKRG